MINNLTKNILNTLPIRFIDIVIQWMMRKMDKHTKQIHFTVKSFIATWLKVNFKNSFSAQNKGQQHFK